MMLLLRLRSCFWYFLAVSPVVLGNSLPGFPCSFDINAGTQGLGAAIGYRPNPYIRFRIRGATINYDYQEKWSDMDTTIKLHGDNAGLLLDIFPFGGKFYITAGVNFSENKMRYKASLYRTPGMAYNVHLAGRDYRMLNDTRCEIFGKYQWRHAQPYIGIGYQDIMPYCEHLYYGIDLGLNFMGSGKLQVRSKGNLERRDPRTYEWKSIGHDEVEYLVRKEGHNFFKVADDLRVYPVLQLSIGAAF